MNQTIIGVSLLFISALLSIGKMIGTAILTASFQDAAILNWEAMMGQTPIEIDIAIIGCLILGALILILNELFGDRRNK
ncbi:hypothetical protein [Terribacillus saccharophilus]|uniref:hypothetical protein n=1 Tax=Terribacillus saccharophilus TaxID=361277 RepID=UPI002DC30A88|nr:hypothetical protein [Terribacillus saccharophilus]MEC0289452.1 hypothetical protein [Terribacillus saccharophilus]